MWFMAERPWRNSASFEEKYITNWHATKEELNPLKPWVPLVAGAHRFVMGACLSVLLVNRSAGHCCCCCCCIPAQARPCSG
eukprot:SAG22_NODE_3325_length_1777_cov_8.503576_2_plen_81_part_00